MVQNIDQEVSAPCGINHLPPEILLRIFKLAFQEHRFKEWWDSMKRTCSSWRALALASPGLWTQIHNTNVSQTREMIRRSGNVPLDVKMNDHFNISKQKEWSAFTLAMTQSNRIDSMTIQLNPQGSPKDVSVLTDVLGRHLPLLKYCNINASFQQGFVNIALPLNAPRLTQLRITGAILSPSSQTSSSLRYFSHRNYRSRIPGLGAREALVILANMPMLEVLGMEIRIIPNPVTGVAPGLLAVRLDNLNKLFLQGYFGEVFPLLSNLRFPATADLNIKTNYLLTQGDATAPFQQVAYCFQPFAAFLPHPGSQLAILIDCFRESFTVSVINRKGSGCAAVFSVEFSKESGSWEWHDFSPYASALLRGLSELPITTLKVSSKEPDSPSNSFVARTLCNLLNIEELQLEMGQSTTALLPKGEIYYMLLRWDLISGFLDELVKAPGWFENEVLPALQRLVIWKYDKDRNLTDALIKTFDQRKLGEIMFAHGAVRREDREILERTCAERVTYRQSGPRIYANHVSLA